MSDYEIKVKIIQEVCAGFYTNEETLRTPAKTAEVVVPRRLIIALVVNNTKISAGTIARYFRLTSESAINAKKLVCPELYEQYYKRIFKN